jgi:hypothetical protein
MVLTVTAARCADFQVKAPGRVAGPLPEVSHDQHAHLDALLCGIFMLVNLMAGKNHVGVMLNSGGCVHALKELVDKDFDRFEEEFDAELCGKMKGEDREEKLERAWSHYAKWKLGEKGCAKVWRRVYLELGEFDLMLASYSVVHYGSRFPLFFKDDALRRPVPSYWYNLRLHLYSQQKWVLGKDSNVSDGGHDHPVETQTIDLADPIPDYEYTGEDGKLKSKPSMKAKWKHMRAAIQFWPPGRADAA